MPTTSANGLDLYHDTFGDPTAETVLLVSGLGAQCIGYEVELCEAIAARGFHVVRYDNRDVGLSTHLDHGPVDVMAAVVAAFAGEVVHAPYDLSDMAADGMALLDALGVDAAHVVGASMGGMIAQTMAIEHPDRVRSLTSIMSTTGEREYGTPATETLTALMGIMSPVEDRAGRIEQGVELARIIGTDWTFDEAKVRERTATLIDRSYDPEGTSRQMMAILASGSRAEGLATLDLPTVVLHGDRDPLVDISGGRRTAELVPGAELSVLERMGHDLPPQYWDRIVGGVLAATGRS
jgi:pimeloyl-ACP methyl ester carboxylesterase